MNTTTNAAPSLPPAIQQYLDGAPLQSRQFNFLIGDWQTASRRFAPDGKVIMEIRGRWRASLKFDGRMIQDEYEVFLPDGRAMASFITLRTWCHQTQQWEMATLASHTPAGVTSFNGRLVDGEMHLQVSGKDPATGQAAMTRVRFFNIQAERFEWEQLNTLDGGATWLRGVSIVAVRRTNERINEP